MNSDRTLGNIFGGFNLGATSWLFGSLLILGFDFLVLGVGISLVTFLVGNIIADIDNHQSYQ